jgi:hypothetical protein
LLLAESPAQRRAFFVLLPTTRQCQGTVYSLFFTPRRKDAKDAKEDKEEGRELLVDKLSLNKMNLENITIIL